MKTEILTLIDRSGSMAIIAEDAIGGFNTFLKDQREVKGKARMTLALFDDFFEYVYQGKKLSEATDLTCETFVPRGSTALLDSLGKLINEQAVRIKAEDWADKVILCILTDGGENASKEFTTSQVKQLIETKQGEGWTVVFLAANQDAFAVGQSYGIARDFTKGFISNSQGTQNAYLNISASVTGLRSN
jgi:Mg-chelatase subunit ChlD